MCSKYAQDVDEVFLFIKAELLLLVDIAIDVRDHSHGLF